ncbi:aldehyde dehydrogenase family protein [Streptomyces sp. NPDC101776]|uniref:aldehyde dehydrogenase family protein n=1 Tax=Streptomyces sp. NPDC101776 TaxID=3366146 RepID=UPI0038156BB5
MTSADASCLVLADIVAGIVLTTAIESPLPTNVNCATVQDEPQMPLGGVGASGWGRFGSRAAIEEFTELRRVTIQSGERHHPIRQAESGAHSHDHRS